MSGIQIPEKFYQEEIKDFLEKTEFIFTKNKTYITNFTLDLSHIKEISILGMLVIYKFIAYTVKHSIFRRPVLSWGLTNSVKSLFNEFGFTPLIDNFVNNKNKNKIEESYKALKSSTTDVLFCAPHSMLRTEANRNELEQEFLNKIAEFYDSTRNSIVNLCTSELMLNFWSHATIDADSIIVAKGGKTYFNLFLIDNGEGLISSLKRNPIYQGESDEDLLYSVFEEGISSKPNTNHQGRGLFLVRELVKLNEGELIVFTEGFQYRLKDGKINVSKAPYWKGVVMTVKLKLRRPRDITHLLKPKFRYKIRSICNND